MHNQTPTRSKPRIAFLLLLALVVTVLFFWIVKGFLLAVFMAAILAALLHPFYRRVLDRTGGRKGLASTLTVLLSLLFIIVPVMLFSLFVIHEAGTVAESAKEWLAGQEVTTEGLRKEIEGNENLKRLLPYQDELIEKGNQFAAKAGTWVAQGLAAGVKGTAEFFLTLLVLLTAMSYFLQEGRSVLDATLRYTPLSGDDKSKILGTFVSVARATLKGKLVIGIVQGGLAGLAFWVAGIEGAVFWSVLMAICSVIPVVGAALVWVPAVIFLAVNGQVGAAIGVAAWCAVVVGTIDNILGPVLIGKDTQMPDLLVLLTTLGGLAVFGAAGILIGPTIGSLYVAVWKLWGGAVDEARSAEAGPNETAPA